MAGFVAFDFADGAAGVAEEVGDFDRAAADEEGASGAVAVGLAVTVIVGAAEEVAVSTTVALEPDGAPPHPARPNTARQVKLTATTRCDPRLTLQD